MRDVFPTLKLKSLWQVLVGMVETAEWVRLTKSAHLIGHSSGQGFPEAHSLSEPSDSRQMLPYSPG